MASNAKALSFLSGDLSLSGTEVSINVAGSVQSDSITGSTITMKNTGSTIVASDGTTSVLSESSGTVTIDADVSTIGSATISGGSITGTEIDLKSSGTTIFASDGTTAVLSESGGVVTLTADEANVGSNALVVNSSGNVGIGTTSPSYPLHISGTGHKRLKIEKTDAGGDADLQISSPNDSTGWILFHDNNAGNNSGVIKYVHSTNKMHFRTNDVDDRLVISADGNVGIGTFNPQDVLDLGNATGGRGISWGGSTGTSHYGTIWSEYGNASIIIGAGLKGSTNNDDFIYPYTGTYGYAAIELDSFSDDGIKFYTAADGSRTKDATATKNERMRIDTSGNLLVNASSFQGGSTVGIQLNATNNASNAYAMLIKNSDGSEIFQFKCNGSASSSTGTWGSISDINLKENIIDATNKLSDVLKLKVKNFNFKSDPEKTKYIGFIAQELETIFPNLVEESVDGIKSVKTSILIPILTKAIQEQQAIIESQQSQIDTLTVKTQEQDFTIASLISRIEALENA